MENSLCEICGYSLRLTKINHETRQNNVQLVEDLLTDPASVENYIPIDMQMLSNSEAFKKLSRSERNKILKMIPDSENIYYHKCKNRDCNNVKLLKPSTIIYEESTNRTQDDYTRFKFSKILPKTSKYICPNKQCQTHTNANLREATFFRINNSLQLVYMCQVCNHYWKKE